MITLQNADPNPVTTPSASIGQRLTGQGSTNALRPLDTTSAFGDVTVTAGCTYGVPRLGTSLLSDVSDLTRLSMPACADQPASLLAPAPPMLGAYFAGPLSIVRPGEALESNATPNTFTMRRAPAKSFAIEHLALPQEFNSGIGAPTAARARATAPEARATAARRTAH
ncbi:MAG: hypothetical protein IAI49_01495 [Candidatus Eremiobacteraeota bacterium]|nr:hypothetical protein [Candidatus Eremiobacteraeota bacterium]